MAAGPPWEWRRIEVDLAAVISILRDKTSNACRYHEGIKGRNMKTTNRNHARLRYLRLLIVLATGMAGLLAAGAISVLAQESQTITATGTFGSDSCSAAACLLTLTFPPAGGAVTGGWVGHGVIEGQAVTGTLTMTGTYAGGDGGAASGTWVSTLGGESTDCTSCMIWRGSWRGNFYANGTGSGILDTETVYAPAVSPEVMESKIDDDPWQVTFSPEEFRAALGQADTSDESQPAPPPVAPEAEAGAITSEYIYNTYGITAEDSLGDDQYARTSWTEHELFLLNDVLKELPRALIKKMAVTRIVRNKIAIDEDGHPKPGARGMYSACDRTIDPDCTGSSATIRIFDPAHTQDQFANDPDGDRQLRGTIVHELTHALQAAKDTNAVYRNIKASSGGYAASPVVQNWMDATRNVTDMQDPQYFSDTNGWALVSGDWKLTTPAGNRPPTGYGATLPTEDMADSVKMYLYDPQRLQTSSPQRYDYLRDYIFGGVEYEDGHQKQP